MLTTVSEEKKPVDILFIVPDAKEDTWRRAIKLVFWAMEIKKTFAVMSADTFVYDYGKMSVEDMDAALNLKCKAMVNSGDISKREWKTFEPLRKKLYDYWAAKKGEASDGTK